MPPPAAGVEFLEEPLAVFAALAGTREFDAVEKAFMACSGPRAWRR